mmetsp:Transcript_28840/g.56361  ORF Transcript_28840/g.56361 Transcript_28840/m.56361 type:complete len:234 (-) Transcript_28840:429-1130(-)
MHCIGSHWLRMLDAPMLRVCTLAFSLSASTSATYPDASRESPIPEDPACRSLSGDICRDVRVVVCRSALAILVEVWSPIWLSPRSRHVSAWFRLSESAMAAPPSSPILLPYRLSCLIDLLSLSISASAVAPAAPIWFPRRSTDVMLELMASALANSLAPWASIALSRRHSECRVELFCTYAATSLAPLYRISQLRRLTARTRMPGVTSHSCMGLAPCGADESCRSSPSTSGST